MTKPTPFGHFLLLDRLSVGGMAEVYFAKVFGDEGGERLLALKKILPALAEDPDFVRMFLDEARTAVQLNHPNIVQLFDLGRIEGRYFIALEYVSGQDLRSLLDRVKKRGEPMPFEQALFIASQIADGLDDAHRARSGDGQALHIVHRDVSPQNVLVSFGGALKLIDFGIAKIATRQQHTQVGVLKGKFGYMSPEQVQGLPLDRRSDVFALGIILYELVTGQRLFVGGSDLSVLERVRRAEVTPPRQHNPQIPVELERIVLKALAREPHQRYQWASELSGALVRFLGPDPASTRPARLSRYVGQVLADQLLAERERLERFALVARPPRFPRIPLRGYDGGRRSRGPPSPDTGPATPITFPSEPLKFPAFDDTTEGTLLQIETASAAAAPSGGVSAAELSQAATAPRQRLRPARKAGSWVAAAASLLAVATLALAVGLWRSSRGTGVLAIVPQPAAGVEIEVDLQPVRPTSEGRFVVAGLSPGEHLVLARASGGSRALKTVVRANETTRVDLVLPPSPSSASSPPPVPPAGPLGGDHH